MKRNGKQQRLVKVALRTKNLAEARKRMQRTSAEVQDHFDKIEQQIARGVAPSATTITASEADLRAMVSRWLYDLDKGAVGQRSWAVDDGTREQLLASCDKEEAALQGESGASEVSYVARDILTANRVAADLPNAPWAIVYELVKRALIELVKRDRERLDGHLLFRSFDPTFADVNPNEPPPAAPDTDMPALTIEKMLEEWEADRKPPKRTAYEFSRAVNRLAAHAGHTDPRQVTKTNVVDWKAALLEEGKSAKTVFNSLAAVRAFYGWAVRNDKVSINPVSGVKVAAKAKAGKRSWLPFSDDDAKLILSAARAEKGAKRWLPWLLAYSGARLEEFCQSFTSDIRDEGGIAYLDINADDPDKTIKNSGLARRVPLHPALITEGFLAYPSPVRYFNLWRPHRSIGQRAPCAVELPSRDAQNGVIIGHPVLGGLHHIYHLAA